LSSALYPSGGLFTSTGALVGSSVGAAVGTSVGFSVEVAVEVAVGADDEAIVESEGAFVASDSLFCPQLTSIDAATSNVNKTNKHVLNLFTIIFLSYLKVYYFEYIIIDRFICLSFYLLHSL
jgi:hypothetical protein